MLANAVPSVLQHFRRLTAAASSDEQLLADFLARRSDEAFAALLDRHGPMVLNVCRRILHDAHAAEDVFQATFLVLADRAGAIHRRASLAGFLHGVAYRLAVRARRRRMQNLPAAVCDKAVGPPEELAWKEMLGILDHELGQLSDRIAPLWCFATWRSETQDEAARQLGWSLNTLRRRLAQGRRCSKRASVAGVSRCRRPWRDCWPRCLRARPSRQRRGPQPAHGRRWLDRRRLRPLLGRERNNPLPLHIGQEGRGPRRGGGPGCRRLFGLLLDTACGKGARGEGRGAREDKKTDSIFLLSPLALAPRPFA